MALTAQQIKELDIASQRIAGGGGSQTDIANVNYAKQNYGYAYKPVTQPVSGTQGVQQVQQNPVQQPQTQSQPLTPTQYNQIRTQNNVSPANFDQYFERRGTDIYAKNQAPAQQTPVQEPVPNVKVPDVIPQQDFERFNNANDLGELKNQVTNAINNYQNQLLQAQQIAVPDVNLRQQLIEDTGLAQKQQQLTELNNALRSLEDELAVRFQGRDLSASDFQSELARRAEPLTRQQQMVFEQVSAIQQQINQQVSDQWQQYQAKWQQAQGNAQMAGQYLQVVQSQLDSLFEQQRQGRADELDLLGVALQLPPGQTFTLSDGTEITGMGSNGNLHFIEESDGQGNLTVIAMNNLGEVVSMNQFNVGNETTTTNAPDVEKFGDKYYQWNGMTNQWEAVETGSQPTQKDVNQANEIIGLIDELLNSNAKGRATGASSFMSYLPGTDAYTFKAKFDSLKSKLTLDNLKLMSGVLSDSDIKILQSAATELELGLKEEAFDEALNKIKNSMLEKLPNDPLNIFSSSSFNNDLGKSVNYLGSLGSVTGYGSPLWKWGLDVDLKVGDPVASPVSGKVVYVGENGGFGKQVKVKDSNGNEWWLSHLNGFNVKVGDIVKNGQQIGIGGNSGNVIAQGGGDGSHLDITVKKKDGTYANPRDIYNSLS